MNFIIEQGKHYCKQWWRLRFTTKKVLIGKATFLGDFSYDIGAKHQKDSNKLIGLSDSWHHHISSIRIGWRWNKTLNALEVVGISYNRGKREIKRIKLIETNKEYSFAVYIEKDKYFAVFDGEWVEFERNNRWWLPRLVLNPYFGGFTKAPKDLKFNIKIF
jgi:hypothetical protein